VKDIWEINIVVVFIELLENNVYLESSVPLYGEEKLWL
jgi:hypothetical protein